MRRAWLEILAAGLVIGAHIAAAQAPTRGVALSVGGGLMLANESDKGGSAFFRVSSTRLPVVLDLSLLSAPGQAPIVVVPAGPCPSFGCPATPEPNSGRVTALTIAPAIQLTEGHGSAVLYRLGPAVSWLPDRASGDAAVEYGFKAGVSLRAGVGAGGLLLSADYIRILQSGSDPRWFLPITVGWQF